MTRNITLSADDADLHGARVYAAQHKTTVNALVREYLHTLATKEDRIAQARREILELAEQSHAMIGNAKWAREDLYGR